MDKASKFAPGIRAGAHDSGRSAADDGAEGRDLPTTLPWCTMTLSDLSNSRMRSSSAPTFPGFSRLTPILVSLHPTFSEKRTGTPPVKTGKQRLELTQCVSYAMCMMRLFRNKTEAAETTATIPAHFDSPS